MVRRQSVGRSEGQSSSHCPKQDDVSKETNHVSLVTQRIEQRPASSCWYKVIPEPELSYIFRVICVQFRLHQVELNHTPPMEGGLDFSLGGDPGRTGPWPSGEG